MLAFFAEFPTDAILYVRHSDAVDRKNRALGSNMMGKYIFVLVPIPKLLRARPILPSVPLVFERVSDRLETQSTLWKLSCETARSFRAAGCAF